MDLKIAENEEEDFDTLVAATEKAESWGEFNGRQIGSELIEVGGMV